MALTGRSWHIPYVDKSHSQNPNPCLHVVFLQRVSDEEYSQIVENLREVDEDWIENLDVPKPPPRTLQIKKWIRDYWPSSDVVLAIARDAYSNETYPPETIQSLIFVDSLWEAGICIAARWEGEADNQRLNAVRVRMNIAKTLLSACDANEGHTLASILGSEMFNETKVDLYVDATPSLEDAATISGEEYALPQPLPKDLALSKEEIVIVSLRMLDQDGIEYMIRKIVQGNGNDDPPPPIKVFNVQGSYITRREIRKMFNRIQQNSDEANGDMPLFLVDVLLEGESGQPQLLSASPSSEWRQQTIQIMPIKTEKLISLWNDAAAGVLEEDFTETEEYADIWNAEYVFDLDVHKDFGEMRGAPVFYLKPFTLEEERVVRSRLRELDDIQQDEDWGQDWVYFGYIWRDNGQQHSMHDLRDLFESCDHYSSTFSSERPGPYRLYNYPSHFIAVDDHIFESEPQVWLASSLDFHLDDCFGDQLGWTYGLVPASTAHLSWVNLDIANMGPSEQIDEPKKLWLSDLREAKKGWESLYEEE